MAVDGSEQRGTHYWRMVLESGGHKFVASGRVTPGARTRYDMEKQIRADMVQSFGPDADGAVVTNFDIQPDAL